MLDDMHKRRIDMADAGIAEKPLSTEHVVELGKTQKIFLK